MRINININADMSPIETRPGNVYQVRGGRGARVGHMMVLLAVTEPKDCYSGRSALMLVIDKDGEPVGCTSYGLHYFDDKMPIAFADGVEDIDLRVRPLGDTHE